MTAKAWPTALHLGKSFFMSLGLALVAMSKSSHGMTSRVSLTQPPTRKAAKPAPLSLVRMFSTLGGIFTLKVTI